MSPIHVWSAVGLLFVLLLAPSVTFLFRGYSQRRRDLIDGLSEYAMESYFKAFHQHATEDPNESVQERFRRYYSSQFGRQRFILPLFLLAAIGGLLLCWSGLSIPDLLTTHKVSDGKLPELAIVAVMGAYMWVVFDQIKRWYCSDLSPSDIYSWCFRFAIAVPMGYAAKDLFTEKLAMPLVFFLGAFPTSQLMTICKRIAIQKMGFSGDDNNALSELQRLQGIDFKSAEQFSAEGITTILELAYYDPIKLTIRTGFTYSYIVDCLCQALLWVYTEGDVVKLRRAGLRSAYEVLDLWFDLNDPQKKERAEQILRETAIDLSYKETSLRNIIEQVALDPYTQFLFFSWADITLADLTEEQRNSLQGS